MRNIWSVKKAFALPVILVASLVMMLLLTITLNGVTSTVVILKDQSVDRLAKEAAESGVSMAQKCLQSNNYSPTGWTSSLLPNTDCTGTARAGFSCPDPSAGGVIPLESRCAVYESQNVRTTFRVSTISTNGSERTYVSTGIAYAFRTSNRTLQRKYEVLHKTSIIFKNHAPSSRAAKAFWLFGNKAGIDFGTTGTSQANPIVAPCTATCYAGEGSTVIATKTGTLQFWTNGQTIWNRDGVPMANGTDLNANASTTQAAVVFPITHDETKYGVITNNTEAGVKDAGELYYSTIDMTLNGGLGDVVTKNNPLWGSTTGYSSEASTAAPKPDGSGYWILTFNPGSTNVHVFSFDIASQTSSHVITVSSGGGIGRFYPTQSGFGSLNFNEDYTRLVLAAGNHCTGTCAGYYGLIRTLDFDSSTGYVTNRNMWNGYANGTGYSADFSPQGNYVYSATLYPADVVRYNISGSPSNATIKSSEAYVGRSQPVTATSCTGGGQVLRAPNNRMYVANCGTNSLSVITNPDAATVGSVGWSYNGFTLAAGTQSSYGLPQMATIYTPKTVFY